MANEEGEGVKKKISKGALDIMGRVNSWIGFGVRKATFDYIRLKSVKTSVDIPIVRIMRREIGKSVVPIFNFHIAKLDLVEGSWGSLQDLWRKLMNYYVGIGLKRSADYTGEEIAMCKFGSRLSEAELAKEIKSIEKGEEVEVSEQQIMAGPAKLSPQEVQKWIKDIDEEKLKPAELEKKREEFKRAICPLDNPNFVDWHEIKLDVLGKEVSEIYPLPKEVTVRTWSSLINDANFTLDRYPARFFGFEKYSDWSNAFEITTKRLCGKVAKILGEDEKFKNKMKAEGKSPDYVSAAVQTQIKDAFTNLLKNTILKKTVLWESDLYPYLRRRTQQFAGSIGTLANDVDNLRPSKLVKIHFKRTYKIIDPKRVIRAKVYNNAYPLYKELVRLNNRLKKPVDLEVTQDGINLFKWCEDESESPREAKHKKGPFFFYLERKYGDSTDYTNCGKLEAHLQKKFEDVNKRLKEEGHKDYYLTWGMIEGASFGDRSGHKDGQGQNDERAPGLDENGWPFEVEEDGTILLDKWEHRKIRKVPEDFVTDMDLLLKANIINNEYDAVRDDLRDGRYHINSLTVCEYILAEMAKWATESSKLTMKEFKTRFRYAWNLNDKSAEYEMGRYPRDENDVPPYNLYGGSGPVHGKRIPSDLNPAFDLRAFKRKAVMDKWVHLGRKRYYDTAEGIWDQLTDADMQDPEVLKAIGPTMSTRGLSMYIIERIVSHVRDFEDAGKILESLAKKWYDYGPRGVNKPGPKNPLKLNIQELTASLEAEKTLKLIKGVTDTEDRIKSIFEGE